MRSCQEEEKIFLLYSTEKSPDSTWMSALTQEWDKNLSEGILAKFQLVSKYLFHKIFGQPNVFSEYNYTSRISLETS